MTQEHGLRAVRAAVAGADRAFQVVQGGKRGGDGPPPAAPPDGDNPPPIIALGHVNGTCHFLDVVGQKRELTARQLGQRHDMLLLFGGNDAWLRQHFPKRAALKKTGPDGQEITEDVVVDFQINRASAFLQRLSFEAGLFGEHVVLRRPGVWADADGRPVVHCGDLVLQGDHEHRAGSRIGGQIWAAAPATARPSTPCDASIARGLQDDLKHLWNFRAPGGEIAVLGLIGTSYYGAAASWRSAGFLLGGAGCGKSSLLNVMRACCPLHHYTNNTSKAGLEQEVDGRAMPCFVDEAGDQENQVAARALLDLVLSASGGEGMKGHRGSVNGQSRKVELVGCIIMSAISPPDMRPQHLGRFTLIELGRPDDGADYTEQHKALAASMRQAAPSLWGRALAGWDRYHAGLRLFRAALARQGCAPREMDQIGALLAGWWVLTGEGLPDERQANEGVGALQAFVRGADDVVEEDAPRRLVRFLLTSLVQMDRSTHREQIGSLLDGVLRQDDGRFGVETARRVLADHGIRAIREDEAPDARGRPVPRAASGYGVWFANQATELQWLFAGTTWEGDRWKYDLRRLESARASAGAVKFGIGKASMAQRAIWVSAEELGFELDDDAPPD